MARKPRKVMRSGAPGPAPALPTPNGLAGAGEALANLAAAFRQENTVSLALDYARLGLYLNPNDAAALANAGDILDQLDQLTDRFLEFRPDPFLTAAPLANWPQAIAMMERLAVDGARAGDPPLIVVLDEFPYYVSSTPELPSLIQDAWEHWKTAKLPLVLVLARG